jgi:hypothetical protein
VSGGSIRRYLPLVVDEELVLPRVVLEIPSVAPEVVRFPAIAALHVAYQIAERSLRCRTAPQGVH